MPFSMAESFRRNRRAAKRAKVFAKTGGTCWLCGARLTLETMTMDHVTPRSKGGSNMAWNLMPACAGCNNARGDGEPVFRRPPAPTDEAIARQKRDEELLARGRRAPHVIAMRAYETWAVRLSSAETQDGTIEATSPTEPA